jgi:CBS-domain-containing membrane protein
MKTQHIDRLFERGVLRPLQSLPERVRQGIYVFANGFISLAILAALAAATGSPLVFPSLGPTAYVLYLFPLAPGSSPRDCLAGHAIGILCGYAALFLTGLAGLPDSSAHAISWHRVVAAALSLSATAAGMVFARVNHAPACATTLIVSLGIISRPVDLLLIELAVLLLVIQAGVLNRLAGVPYPVWSGRR